MEGLIKKASTCSKPWKQKPQAQEGPKSNN